MRKLSILLVLFVALGAIRCGGKHPSDVVAAPLMGYNESYIFVVERLNDARRAGLINDEVWDAIDSVADPADELAKKANESWYQLSALNTPENAAQLAVQLRQLIEFVKSLMSYLPNEGDRTMALNKINSDLENIKKLEAQK